MSSTVYIASAVRTPVGRRGGALAGAHAPELLAGVLEAVVQRSGIPAAEVEQVLAGCVTQIGDQAYNIGRMAWLTAGLPETTAGTTLDAQCGSSQQAVNLGAALIRAGSAEVVVACGVEVMSTHPLGSNVEAGNGHPMGERYRARYDVTSQGESAERIADAWGIDRDECDEIGLRSQLRAAEAWRGGRFADEILALDELGQDEGLRASSREGLAALKPVFRENGRHTAGNSSQLSDGAAALVLVSEAARTRHDIAPLARVTEGLAVGVDPVLKLTGPIPATRAIFARTGLGVHDFDLFEVNEAFASVIAAWSREIDAPTDRVNVHGGAIALGHPVGASGARLCTTAVHALRHRGGGRALVTMCCGGGLGTATVIEVP